MIKLRRMITGKHLINAENRKLFDRILFVCIFIVLLILISSYFVWKLEYSGVQENTIRTFWDSIWWAIVTVATVGYGDKVPITNYGRLVGLVLIIVGFTLLSVFTGLIASLFVEDKIKGAKGLKQIRAHKHIVVCGWNKTGEALLRSLVEKNLLDTEICLIINQSQEFFDSIQSQFRSLQIRFVRGEPTQEEILRRASINTAAQVFVLADQALNIQNADDRSIIVANAVHYLASKTKITVQLLNGENKNLLQRIGISEVLVYDDLGGGLLASSIIESNSLNIFSNLLGASDHSFITCEVADEFEGKTYGELFDHLYREKGRLLVGLISKEATMDIESIFDDNASAIDQFIKSTLSDTKKMQQDEKNNIRWNPPRESIIQDNDHAIILA